MNSCYDQSWSLGTFSLRSILKLILSNFSYSFWLFDLPKRFRMNIKYDQLYDIQIQRTLRRFNWLKSYHFLFFLPKNYGTSSFQFVSRFEAERGDGSLSTMSLFLWNLFYLLVKSLFYFYSSSTWGWRMSDWIYPYLFYYSFCFYSDLASIGFSSSLKDYFCFSSF